MDKALIRQTVQEMLPQAQQFLCDIMKFPSTSGMEHDEMLFIEQAFRQLPAVEVERIPMSNAIRKDPDFCDPVPGIEYDGRFNLRVELPGVGGGRKLLFNAHTDTVPPSDGMTEAWNPRLEDGKIFGRGACDDKGQVAVFYLICLVAGKLGLRFRGDVVGHLVNEEENGGNGSLAMARTGEKGDACVVLEPTDSRILTEIRGAVWFRVVFHGIAGHSGEAGQTRSALLLARDGIGILEKYHADLLKSSRGFPLFDKYANPMPITFGKLHAGNWPAAAPNEAVLEGVLGFLPNKTKEDICAEMKAALIAGGLKEEDFTLTFMYRHDCSVVASDHELPQGLLKVAQETGYPLEIDAWTASCDAWFYNNQLEIPTVVCGAGTLKVAHSIKENIEVASIARTAEIMLNFMGDFCTVAE
ncbi:MAG: M20/M25/M40 family metallo-hydrolase [Lentisphaeria bacterium]|nr:M20/M25/M40 family metallo-hydrolase [Lentisphaeria bacterium]